MWIVKTPLLNIFIWSSVCIFCRDLSFSSQILLYFEFFWIRIYLSIIIHKHFLDVHWLHIDRLLLLLLYILLCLWNKYTWTGHLTCAFTRRLVGYLFCVEMEFKRLHQTLPSFNTNFYRVNSFLFLNFYGWSKRI